MPNDANGEPNSTLRTISRYLWFVLGVTLLYVGWIFFSRWDENRRVEQRELERKRAEAQRTLELLGGNRFEIVQFYASPGVIQRGETAQLCYGVSNAKTVRLEPQGISAYPSFSRCVAIAPRKDTTYTLTALDAAGNSKTASVLVRVR